MRPILLSLMLASLAASAAGGQPRERAPVDARRVAAGSACDVDSMPYPLPLAHAEALAAFPGRARAEGRVLRIGRFKLTEPGSVAHEDERVYSYAGPFGELGMDLVVVQDFDSIGWMLLDQVSGKTMRVPALPLPAPDGRRFLFLYPWTPAEEGRLEIRERTARGWRKLAEIPASRACDLRWLDDGAVAYREREGYSVYVGGPQKTWRPRF